MLLFLTTSLTRCAVRANGVAKLSGTLDKSMAYRAKVLFFEAALLIAPHHFLLTWLDGCGEVAFRHRCGLGLHIPIHHLTHDAKLLVEQHIDAVFNTKRLT